MSQGSKRWLPSSHFLAYMEATRKTKLPIRPKLGYTPSKGTMEIVFATPSDGCPATANLCRLDASLAILTHVLRFEVSRLCRRTPVRPVSTGQTSLELLQLSLGFFGIGFVDQPRNLGFSSEPPKTPRTWCSLRQLPHMTRHPRSLGSTLVLRLYQETVHDFILSFLPPCGPHLTPLATGSLERSLLVFSTSRGLTGNNLSRLFFTCTSTSQDATCSCNT
jgi:hypothetical protein